MYSNTQRTHAHPQMSELDMNSLTKGKQEVIFTFKKSLRSHLALIAAKCMRANYSQYKSLLKTTLSTIIRFVYACVLFDDVRSCLLAADIIFTFWWHLYWHKTEKQITSVTHFLFSEKLNLPQDVQHSKCKGRCVHQLTDNMTVKVGKSYFDLVIFQIFVKIMGTARKHRSVRKYCILILLKQQWALRQKVVLS